VLDLHVRERIHRSCRPVGGGEGDRCAVAVTTELAHGQKPSSLCGSCPRSASTPPLPLVISRAPLCCCMPFN
jgi:hypothetical protein